MLLFVLCSLASWICPLPEAPAAITAEPITAENVQPEVGIAVESHPGIGSPFLATGPKDTGYCGDDFDYTAGWGWSGSLLWPVAGGTLHEAETFRIGHTGADIDGSTGQAVQAAIGGRVVYAGWSSYGFGNLVILAHGGGWQTFYGHMSSPVETLAKLGVICGAAVSRGQTIGYVGQSGAAQWPHVHFEVRNGATAYDPLPFLAN